MNCIAVLSKITMFATDAPIVLRGRFGGEELVINQPGLELTANLPLLLLGLLATLLLTGAAAVAQEVRTETRDRKAQGGYSAAS